MVGKGLTPIMQSRTLDTFKRLGIQGVARLSTQVHGHNNVQKILISDGADQPG
jgi:hypothetical protein